MVFACNHSTEAEGVAAVQGQPGLDGESLSPKINEKKKKQTTRDTSLGVCRRWDGAINENIPCKCLLDLLRAQGLAVPAVRLYLIHKSHPPRTGDQLLPA
jgi:hypothetical protein